MNYLWPDVDVFARNKHNARDTGLMRYTTYSVRKRFFLNPFKVLFMSVLPSLIDTFQFRIKKLWLHRITNHRTLKFTAQIAFKNRVTSIRNLKIVFTCNTFFLTTLILLLKKIVLCWYLSIGTRVVIKILTH